MHLVDMTYHWVSASGFFEIRDLPLFSGVLLTQDVKDIMFLRKTKGQTQRHNPENLNSQQDWRSLRTPYISWHLSIRVLLTFDLQFT